MIPLTCFPRHGQMAKFCQVGLKHLWHSHRDQVLDESTLLILLNQSKVKSHSPLTTKCIGLQWTVQPQKFKRQKVAAKRELQKHPPAQKDKAALCESTKYQMNRDLSGRCEAVLIVSICDDYLDKFCKVVSSRVQNKPIA